MSRGIHRKALSMGLTFALILSLTLVTAVSANSGGITSLQSCSAGEVHVFLNNNVSPDRKVTVTSTIPGFTDTGITDKSYDTTGNAGNVEIWSASGPQPFAGKVTLVIKFSNGAVEASYTKTMTAQAPCPAPGFTVDKGVSLSGNGPFVGELTTTTGTTVHYRITITNTGNVPLTGVTLSDNTFDLGAKGCMIPATLAVGAHFDCDYTSTAVTGTTTNIATGDTDQTESDTGTAKVIAAPAPEPGLRVRKAVGLAADGPFVNILTVEPGTTVFYRITVTNTGNVPLTGVTLIDDTFDLVAKGCTIPTTLAVGASFDCDYSSVSAETQTVNVATGDSNETEPDSDTATVNPAAQQAVPVLTVDKTNGAPIVHTELPGGGSSDLPTSSEGSTVTFTLSYTLTDGPVTAGTINDVLPVGLTYVGGSAMTNGEFTAVSYNPATRTLTWTAATVSANGTVTYKAKVNAGASGLGQPLRNTATIDSAETEPDSDTSDVFVPAPPKAETAPPTDTLEPSQGPSGSSLPLALAVIGVVLLAAAVVTSVPATMRRRKRD